MNNKSLFLLFLLFQLGTAYKSTGQQIERAQFDSFVYEDKIYRSFELGPVLKANKESYYEFMKSMQYKRKAKKLGVFTLGAMGVATLLIAVDNPSPGEYCDFICLTTGDIIGLMTWLFVVPSTGTAAIVLKLRSRNKFIKAVTSFNDGNSHSMHLPEESVDLKLGLSQNGLGLQLSF